MSCAATIDALTRSVRTFGQLQPIIVGADGQIIDGRLREAACQQAQVEPWRVVRADLKPEARLQFMIRRAFDPLELADLAAYLREVANPSGARRAHGSGKTKDIVAREMREQFGRDISPREVAYALSLATASAGERAAVERADPSSMRAAQRTLSEHRSGVAVDGTAPEADTRTELLKRANELRAAAIRHQGPIGDADRTVLLELRAVIDRMLDNGSSHASA